jgi:hypothetical protein
VLKKAGLVAMASIASMVAASPLAFAGGEGTHVGGDHGGHDGNQNSHGLVNGANGSNVNVPIQLCNNDIQPQVGLVPVQDVGENATLPGLNGALGAGTADQHGDSANIRSCGQNTAGAGFGNH